MKILSVTIFLFFSFVLIAQTRDLDYYLTQAKTNSPLINKSRNDNKIIELDMRQIKSILSKPMINVDASVLFAPIISHNKGSNKFEWISEGATDYTGYDLAFSDGGQYQAYISVNQPIFTKSIYNSYSNKAELSRKINENNITLTYHELERLVSYQYLICLKLKKQNKISLDLVIELKRQLQILEHLVKNAIYKQTDLLLLQIELQNFELEYKTQLFAYRNNIADLNLICGINDTTTVEIQNVNFELKLDTLSVSHFLSTFKLDSLNIEAEQLLYEQKYKPRINLFANAGMAAIYLPDFNRFGFSTGISFSWNIFDGHQRKIEQEKSMVKSQTIAFKKQNFINKYELNKNKFLNQISSINQQIAIIETQLKQYNKLMDLYKLELAQSQISIMDFKIVIKDIAAKKQELVQLKMEKQLLINSYNYWNY